ncbi:cobalt ECF transporter T component CbiQ [Caenispirillum salinarum]|uniref:cobalt ECF transporter T component CbiQ n=1 Tax=Caenispirillum salinarum TaxID=859058 RepID=UPI00384DF062
MPTTRPGQPAIRSFADGPDAGPRRLDPRARVLAAVAFAVAVVALTGLPALVAAVGVAFGLAVWARLPLKETARRVAAMDGFILLTLVMLPFTTPPAAGTEPLFTLWGLPASRGGLEHAVRIALKANAVILALLALVGTMRETVLGHALGRLGVPAKLVTLFLMTVRYIEVLHAEYGRLRWAMKARGFRPRTDLHTLKSLGHLVGMLLVRSLERSERVLAAMKCRGYTGRLPLLDTLRAGPADWAFGAAAAIGCVVLVAADRLA